MGRTSALPLIELVVDPDFMKRLSFLAIVLFFTLASLVEAQVPAEFTDLYAELEGNLTNFEATLDANWDGLQTDCLMGAVLLPATSEGRGWGSSGDASKDTNFLNSIVVPYLDGLQALGIRSVKFAIQFRLAGQDDLKQFAVPIFQIAEQSDLLKDFPFEVVGFIDDQDDRAAVLRLFDQQLVERKEHLGL